MSSSKKQNRERTTAPAAASDSLEKSHKWGFRARFRRHAFGWKSLPAITRIREAVSEIKNVRRKDPMLAAEGAVLFLEKVSPALEHVDSSSGAIGTAVNSAIAVLVEIIAAAPANESTRQTWLQRLFDAHAADKIPYIETLADYWGQLCASPQVASHWADELIGITRLALSPDKNLRGSVSNASGVSRGRGLGSPLTHVAARWRLR